MKDQKTAQKRAYLDYYNAAKGNSGTMTYGQWVNKKKKQKGMTTRTKSIYRQLKAAGLSDSEIDKLRR